MKKNEAKKGSFCVYSQTLAGTETLVEKQILTSIWKGLLLNWNDMESLRLSGWEFQAQGTHTHHTNTLIFGPLPLSQPFALYHMC